jgi:NADH-quinone oxidoreductase subunit G
VGCSVKVSENKNGAFRVKPVYDQKVNGHWMCDDGRKIYKHVSAPGRLGDETNSQEIQNLVANKNAKFILSTCLSNQEYDNFFTTIKGTKTEVALYQLPSIGPEFDGILKRGNKNANLLGALKSFDAHKADHSQKALDKMLNNLGSNDVVYVVVPEIIYDEDHFKTLVSKLNKAGVKIALTPSATITSLHEFDHMLPVPTFLEKTGEITNFQGELRALRPGKSYGDNTKDISYYAKWVNL